MNAGDKEILDHFVRTREATLKLFDRVAPEWLDRTAPGEDRSLGWLFMHIADGPDWWLNHCMQDSKGWQYPGGGPFDKDAICEALRSSLRRLTEFFERDDGAPLGDTFELIPEKREGQGRWTGRNRVLYLADHEVHHRGKIVLALRQWGMKKIPFLPF